MSQQLTLLNQRTLIEQALLDTLRLAFLQRQTVADVAHLQALDVSAGYDGMLCFVTAVGLVYELRMFSGAAQSLPTIAQPTTAPAPYTGARWIQSTSQVHYGPNHLTPLNARTAGYCKVIDLFRGQGGTDEAMLALLETKPSMLLLWQSTEPGPASAGYPGSYYAPTHTYAVWCVSENDRGAPWAVWGDPVVVDPGANGMAAQVEYLFAGLSGSEPGAPRGNLGLKGLLWCEMGATTLIMEDVFQRIFITSTQIKVYCRFACPDEDLVHMPPAAIFVEDRIAQTGASADFDSQNYVAQGYMFPAPQSGRAIAYPASVAVVGGTPVSSTPAGHTMPAKSLTYRDLNPDGTFTYLATALGQDPPPVTAHALRVGVTTTDATNIVYDQILCSCSLSYRASHQVVPPL
jgi:hypothetical protein